MLLVAVNDLCRLSQVRDLAQHLVATFAVLPHRGLLVQGQPPGLQQDRVRNRHLPHVMQERAARHGANLLGRQLHRPRHGNRVRRHSPGVTFRLRIFQVQRVAQRLQRDVVGPLKVPDRAVQHFGAGRHQFLKVGSVHVVLLHERAVFKGPEYCPKQLVALKRL